MNFELKVEGSDSQDIERFREIFGALISSGGLTGVRGGQTIIHFDSEGRFMGVQLSYWPWRKRKKEVPFRYDER